MKVVGLVTEYNPFHNGHQYHIEEARKITGADYVIAVMSGNFVQRGIPAMIDKYSRTRMALSHGVDLVLEIPVSFATGSAEYFAYGAISLLDQLGVVDYLCFGSESGNISLLNKAASYLLNQPANFDEQLQAYLKKGYNYPAARAKTLQELITAESAPEEPTLPSILTEPNNILGIEYLKALQALNSSISPVTIRRTSANYHDKRLSNTEISNQPVISSATAIRKTISEKLTEPDAFLKQIYPSIPETTYKILEQNYHKTYPVTEEDFLQIIHYKLLAEDKCSLLQYMDVSDDLADRLKKLPGQNFTYHELVRNIKTKNMTLTRIHRALIHILLNIQATSMESYCRSGYSRYARILGVRQESTPLLRSIDKAGRIPVITRVSKAEKQLDTIGMQMLQEDIFAAHLYNQTVYQKFGISMPNEYQHGIILI